MKTDNIDSVPSPLSTHYFINCDMEMIFYLTNMKVKNHGLVAFLYRIIFNEV
jgi:hypothetical protein